VTMKRLDIEEIGDITIARFIDRKIVDDAKVEALGFELKALVDTEGRRKIILDFSNVEYLSDATLSKLIVLDKKVKAVKGTLRLCSVHPAIYEVFVTTRLNKLFDIHPDRADALIGM
jgi:anti-sigma B factor antagonist